MNPLRGFRGKILHHTEVCCLQTNEHASFSSIKFFVDRFPVLLLDTELNQGLDILQTEFCKLQSTALSKEILDEPRADVGESGNEWATNNI